MTDHYHVLLWNSLSGERKWCDPIYTDEQDARDRANAESRRNGFGTSFGNAYVYRGTRRIAVYNSPYRNPYYTGPSR